MLFQNPNIDLTLGSMYRCDTKRLSELGPRETSSSDPRLCFPFQRLLREQRPVSRAAAGDHVQHQLLPQQDRGEPPFLLLVNI